MTERLLRCGTDATSDYVPQECFSSRGFTLALKPTTGNYMDFFMHEMLVKHMQSDVEGRALAGNLSPEGGFSTASSTAFSGSFVNAHLDDTELSLPLREDDDGDTWDIGDKTGHPGANWMKFAVMWYVSRTATNRLSFGDDTR